jgi:hypothetical protein
MNDDFKRYSQRTDYSGVSDPTDSFLDSTSVSPNNYILFVHSGDLY